MGMFDDVAFRTKCPSCGAEMSKFQSKNGPCTMSVISPVEARYFYNLCSCGKWVSVEMLAPSSGAIFRVSSDEFNEVTLVDASGDPLQEAE